MTKPISGPGGARGAVSVAAGRTSIRVETEGVGFAATPDESGVKNRWAYG